MARIRTIKPEFFTDEDLTAQPPLVRLFFVGLFCQADKAGRVQYKPRQLKVRILPFDNLSGEKAVDALVEGGFVVKYEVGGETYLVIRNWVKHQRPHHTEKDSELPPPPNGVLTVTPPLENGRKGREGKGKEGKGKEGKEAADADVPHPLIELIDGWNLLGTTIANSGAETDPPAEAVLAGWRKVQKNPEQRKAFADIPAVLQEIQEAKYCHTQPWFRLVWLFGKNQAGEFIITKLMDKGYRNGGNRTPKRGGPSGRLLGPRDPDS